MTADQLLYLVTIVGLGISLCIFFVWQSAKREERQQKAMTEAYTMLINLVKDTTKALTGNSDALKRTTEVLNDVKAVVRINHQDTTRLLARFETSTCVLSAMGALSSETKQRIFDIKEKLQEKALSESEKV